LPKIKAAHAASQVLRPFVGCFYQELVRYIPPADLLMPPVKHQATLSSEVWSAKTKVAVERNKMTEAGLAGVERTVIWH
jgi:hypothetical protein